MAGKASQGKGWGFLFLRVQPQQVVALIKAFYGVYCGQPTHPVGMVWLMKKIWR